MDTLKVHSQTITLVDQVEDKLLNYLKEKDIRTGDSIPNELELAAALGVARSVLREALSRLKMMGMIETRTRRGMILTEPTILGGMERVVDPRILGEEALFDILGFRIALEIGICSDIFRNITPEDISELEEIVKMVGMDALSPTDRLKMEAARSIREDFLHQNSFHEVDTYTSLKKQHMMMVLVNEFFDRATDALKEGASLQKLISMPVREQIGRFKYVTEDKLDEEFKQVDETLSAQIAAAFVKEEG